MGCSGTRERINEYPYLHLNVIEDEADLKQGIQEVAFDFEWYKIRIAVLEVKGGGYSGLEWFGSEGNFRVVALIKIEIAFPDRVVRIPSLACSGLGNPHLETFELKNESGKMKLSFCGGDGGSAYLCSFFFSEESLVKREVDASGGGVFEISKWEGGEVISVDFKNEYLSVNKRYTK